MLLIHNFCPLACLSLFLLFFLLFQFALVHLIAIIELYVIAARFLDEELNIPDLPTSRRIVVDYTDIFLVLLEWRKQ